MTGQCQISGEILTKIGTSSQHLLSLINDVLDMSRIESGVVKIEEKEMKMNKSVLQRGIIFLLCSCILFSLCPVSAFAAENQKEKVVRIGVPDDTYDKINGNGKRSGYGYEYLQKIAGYTGWKYEYVDCTWENCFDKLKNVLKQIHHEPCDYYQFGNKLEAEIRDYKKLKEIGIKMPAMLEADVKNERILKEFIDGDTIYQLVLEDKMKTDYIEQLHRMCALLYAANTNIDYFPTNFVVHNEEIYYVDFECNDYMEEWNFENWGVKYWSKTPEFLQYVKEHS